MAGQLELPRDLLIGGLEVPRIFYPVLKLPAPLAGMSYPGLHTPWGSLYGIGFRNVVCLCSEHVDYDPAPLRMLRMVEMEDLHHGNDPLYPAVNEKLVREAVVLINERLNKCEGVVVHCVGGTGRTGTIIGCVLRSRGYPADEIIAYLDDVNKMRGRRGWPEAPWQASIVRRF